MCGSDLCNAPPAGSSGDAIAIIHPATDSRSGGSLSTSGIGCRLRFSNGGAETAGTEIIFEGLDSRLVGNMELMIQ